MASDKRPIAATAFADGEDEEGQQQNRKRQKVASSDDGSEEESDDDSEEEKESSPVKAVNIPVKVKAKMPDVPLADDYTGGEFFFVRECYAEYYSNVEAALVEKKRECVTVTGTPGTL
ncbi:hypothetical protein DVH05_016912 [Phytophthora capsici]|nr:hypothetical protein DVH05_007541 [Phytophthora capsici]KAG1709898.1 hypothetical protein DVH05_016912 [Phytophthora capsici]